MVHFCPSDAKFCVAGLLRRKYCVFACGVCILRCRAENAKPKVRAQLWEGVQVEGDRGTGGRLEGGRRRGLVEVFLGRGGAVKRQKARQAEFYLFSILVSLSRSYEVVTFYSKDQFIRKNVPAPNFVKTFGVKIFEKKC